MAGRSIFELLEKDHREVEQLFERIQATKGQTGGNEKAMALLETLSEELKVHMAAEEKAFYTPLRGMKETKEIVTEAEKEHQEARGMIKEIQPSKVDGLLTRVQALQKAIDHHVKEEEGKLFKAARQVADKDLATQMGEQFEREKTKKRS